MFCYFIPFLAFVLLSISYYLKTCYIFQLAITKCLKQCMEKITARQKLRLVWNCLWRSWSPLQYKTSISVGRQARRKEWMEGRTYYSCVITWKNSHIYSSRSKLLFSVTFWWQMLHEKLTEKSAFGMSH